MRIAIFLGWRSDPFRLVTQAKVARTLAQQLRGSELVTTVDMSSQLSKPNVEALLTEGIVPGMNAGARLGNAVRELGQVIRPIVMDEIPRGVAETRYHRIERDPQDLDLGVRSPVSIPRDGAIDCKDAELWLTPDWTSQRQVYSVRPVVLTFHPLADRLQSTASAQAGFAKRMQYLEAAGIICSPGSADLAVRRFGLDRDKLIEFDLNPTRRRMGGRRVLVIPEHETAEQELLKALSGKDREADTSVELVVALPLGPSTGNQGVRVTHVKPGSRRKTWESYVVLDGLSTAASLLEKADAVVVDGDLSDRAFAIARWVDEGRIVVIPEPDTASDLSGWPRLTPLALSLADRTRTAMSRLEAGR